MESETCKQLSEQRGSVSYKYNLGAMHEVGKERAPQGQSTRKSPSTGSRGDEKREEVQEALSEVASIRILFPVWRHRVREV